MNKNPIVYIATGGLIVMVLAIGGLFFYFSTQNKAPAANQNTAATKGTSGIVANDYSDNPTQEQKGVGGDGTDPTGTTQKTASTQFSDGLYLVNDNIAPGTYTNDGTGDCSWKRMNALSGYRSTIEAKEFNGQGEVTILATDKAFSSNGCGTWTKQS